MLAHGRVEVVEVAARIPAFTPRAREADGTHRGRWVLTVSVWPNLSALAFTGRFEGGRFLPEHEQVAAASYDVQSVYGHGHAMYYDNVIRTLRGECEPETDGREGLKSLELLIALYMSARDGRRINLPLHY